MWLIRKWRGWSPGRRTAVLDALVAVVFVRLSLRLLPWRMWERVVTAVPMARVSEGRPQPTAEDIVWAVGGVSRWVPRATCLTQALAAYLLLSRRGHASRLRIGVARPQGDKLLAHAWLESDGLIVLGGVGVEAYTPLRATAQAESHFVQDRSSMTVLSGAEGRGALSASRGNRHFTLGDM